ncbi:hypothetical protein LCGC14_1497150 [marine sediment metagenome]|uniref:Uncharacterized protein n=1 Tax=marine sediment metagenome TaxID=412755 RepID=A0A0F9J5Q9_9ZZZZ
MKRMAFHELYQSRACCIQILFAEKNMQYGSDEDVFANNKKAAAIAQKQPEDFLMTQVAKHIALLCVRAETLAGLDTGIAPEEMEAWRENMDDVSLWMFILNGLLEERFQKGIAEGGV